MHSLRGILRTLRDVEHARTRALRGWTWFGVCLLQPPHSCDSRRLTTGRLEIPKAPMETSRRVLADGRPTVVRRALSSTRIGKSEVWGWRGPSDLEQPSAPQISTTTAAAIADSRACQLLMSVLQSMHSRRRVRAPAASRISGNLSSPTRSTGAGARVRRPRRGLLAGCGGN